MPASLVRLKVTLDHVEPTSCASFPIPRAADASSARSPSKPKNWMEANRYIHMDDLREHKKTRTPSSRMTSTHDRPSLQNLTPSQYAISVSSLNVVLNRHD